MLDTHVILIDRELAVSVKDARRQIAGLYDLLEGGRRYLEGKRLADYTGGVFIYTPKARRGYLEPAPVARVVYVHMSIDPAFATIIGMWLPERRQGWRIPPQRGSSAIDVA